jgi:heme-degrading monooxygenase HmoA
MLARLVQGTIDPSGIADAARAVESELIPAFVRLPGARQGYWMANRSTGRTLTVTIWADADSLRAGPLADGAMAAQGAGHVGRQTLSSRAMEVIAVEEDAAATEAAPRWARATWIEGVPPEACAELGAIYRGVVSEQARISGFRGSCWLADGTTGRGVALSFWDAPDALTRSDRESWRRRRRLAEELGFEVVRVNHFEGLGVAPRSVGQREARMQPSPASREVA